jgi:hypothetical protein
MNNKALLRVVLLLLCVIAQARDITTDPTLLYQLPLVNNSKLEQKVTVDWKFKNFNEFVQCLRTVYGINSQEVAKSEDPLSPVHINIENQTISKLLDRVTARFGYNWVYKSNVVIFSAIVPAPNISRNENSKLKPEIIHPQRSSWSLEPKDKSLRNALAKWCRAANWQLVWHVKADFPITNLWHISGTFEHAINEVLKASQHTETPLLATMHDSNKVLEIHAPAANK